MVIRVLVCAVASYAIPYQIQSPISADYPVRARSRKSSVGPAIASIIGVWGSFSVLFGTLQNMSVSLTKRGRGDGEAADASQRRDRPKRPRLSLVGTCNSWSLQAVLGMRCAQAQGAATPRTSARTPATPRGYGEFDVSHAATVSPISDAAVAVTLAASTCGQRDKKVRKRVSWSEQLDTVFLITPRTTPRAVVASEA